MQRRSRSRGRKGQERWGDGKWWKRGVARNQQGMMMRRSRKLADRLPIPIQETRD
jgi:hypothetical protein